MARVDDRYNELAMRVRDAKLVEGGDARHYFILGGCFNAAWLTGSEIRQGKNPSPYDMQEYRHVQYSLERLGWLDLLDA